MGCRPRVRRGAEAVEFALVAPVMIALVFGAIDYGLFFWQQARAATALDAAMRVGSMTAAPPEEWGNGACSTCLSAVSLEASQRLSEVGFEVAPSALEPEIVGVGPNVPASGGRTCALTLSVDLPYSAITGFTQVPERFKISSQVVAQGARGC